MSADEMHDILTDAGFDTTYLGPQEDTNPDRDGEATTQERVRWFFNKAREMKPSQTLFVYITGHGGITDSGTAALGSVFENLLKDALDDFDPGVHIIVVLDGCHSGAFNDSMVQVADITITSTDANSSAYADLDRYFFKTDVNPDDEGLEYTSGFVEDWREIMADPAARQRVQTRASREGVNFWEALAPESYLTAVQKDFAFALGWTAPQLVRGQPQTRPTSTPTPSATLAATSTPPVTATPSVATLPPSGEIPVQVAIGEDRANHDPFIVMPRSFSLNYLIAVETITFSGPFPWVTVSGEEPDSEGKFFASGKGVVAGFTDITTEFSGAFQEQLLVGNYVMGADGGLPSGLAITYTITGTLPLAVPAATPPPPTLEPGSPVTETLAAQSFFLEQNRLFLNQDVQGLYDRLHPAVLNLYGDEACSAYLASVIDTPVQVDAKNAVDIGIWNWEIDKRQVPVPDSLEVEVDFTARGQTVPRTVHLAYVQDQLRWFTDCGDPLP